MKLPDGLTEEAVLATIENACRVLCPRFVFPGYDLADLQQEARIEGLRVLARYDPRPDENGNPTRPLENYLFRCVRFFLIRLKRDKYKRTDDPCPACRDGEEHERGRRCDVHARWVVRNAAKASLMKTADIDEVSEDRYVARDDVRGEVEVSEILKKIDIALPVELRGTYLAMRAGQSVSKHKRQAVEEAVKAIVGADVLA